MERSHKLEVEGKPSMRGVQGVMRGRTGITVDAVKAALRARGVRSAISAGNKVSGAGNVLEGVVASLQGEGEVRTILGR